MNDELIAFATQEFVHLLTIDGRLITRYRSPFRENDVGFSFGQLSWHPSRDRLIYCGRQSHRWSRLFSSGLDGTQQRRLFPPDDWEQNKSVHSPQCAPDGRRIAFLASGPAGSEMGVLDPSRNACDRLKSGDPAQTFASPVWLGSGDRVVFVRTRQREIEGRPAAYESSSLEICDFRTHEQQRLSVASGREVLEQVRAAPDGRRLAFLRRRDLEMLGGRTYGEWSQGIANARQADYLRKIARQIHAMPFDERVLMLYDLSLRQERLLYRGDVEAFDWGPQGDRWVVSDGRRILLLGENAEPELLHRVDGGEVLSLAWAS